MFCPNCGKETGVIDSRETEENSIRRRRECFSCGSRFTTYERIETPNLTVIKRDGREEPFDKEKIVLGMKIACQKTEVTDAQIEALADEIEQKIMGEGEEKVKSRRIGNMVIKRLKGLDEVAYLRFASVYKGFEDIESFEEEIEKLTK